MKTRIYKYLAILTVFATVCFYFDSDNTGLNMRSIWCAYFA